MSKAILFVNLGSSDSPSVPDVRRYLNEFLITRTTNCRRLAAERKQRLLVICPAFVADLSGDD